MKNKQTSKMSTARDQQKPGHSKTNTAMKKAAKKETKGIVSQLGEQIKLQLDYRTMIYVRSKESLKMWMSKYPNARVIA
jgi:hypothetical protein